MDTVLEVGLDSNSSVIIAQNILILIFISTRFSESIEFYFNLFLEESRIMLIYLHHKDFIALDALKIPF